MGCDEAESNGLFADAFEGLLRVFDVVNVNHDET